MPHSKSLRAVGDSLQFLGVKSFVLEKAGQGYIVRATDAIDAAKLVKPNLPEKIWQSPESASRHAKLFSADGALHYEAMYITWLDAQGRRKRRKRFSAQASGTNTLAQSMRSLGRHLDRLEPRHFRVTWADPEVRIDYELADGSRAEEVLTLAKLRELTMRSRYRRATRR